MQRLGMLDVDMASPGPPEASESDFKEVAQPELQWAQVQQSMARDAGPTEKAPSRVV